MKFIGIYIIAFFLFGSSCNQELSYYTISEQQSSYVGPQEPTVELIQNDEQADALLSEYDLRNVDFEIVDFSKQAVLFFSLGQRNTSGYSVVFESLSTKGKTLTIKYNEIVPGKDCYLADVLTHPFTMILVDRDINYKSYALDGDTVMKNCDEDER